jgi:hypothetical protein
MRWILIQASLMLLPVSVPEWRNPHGIQILNWHPAVRLGSNPESWIFVSLSPIQSQPHCWIPIQDSDPVWIPSPRYRYWMQNPRMPGCGSAHPKLDFTYDLDAASDERSFQLVCPFAQPGLHARNWILPPRLLSLVVQCFPGFRCPFGDLQVHNHFHSFMKPILTEQCRIVTK